MFAALLAAIASTARTARAEATFALTWRAQGKGAPCVTEAAVRDAVEAALGRAFFVDRERADIVIEGAEQRVGTGYLARVIQRDRTGAELGARDLEAGTCAALRRMTVVVVTLFIEPTRPRDEPPAPTELAPGEADHSHERRPARPPVAPRSRSPSPSPLAAAGPRKPSSSPAPEVADRPRLHLGVGGGTALGLLPRPSASLRAVARLTMDRSPVSFDWSLGFSLPQTVSDGYVRATFSAVDQQVRACYAGLPHLPRTRLDACGGVSFAAIVPSVRGIEGGEGSARSLIGPTAALALRIVEGTAELDVEVGAVVPRRRRTPNFVTRSGEIRTLYATGTVIGLVGLTGTFAFF